MTRCAGAAEYRLVSACYPCSGLAPPVVGLTLPASRQAGSILTVGAEKSHSLSEAAVVVAAWPPTNRHVSGDTAWPTIVAATGKNPRSCSHAVCAIHGRGERAE